MKRKSNKGDSEMGYVVIALLVITGFSTWESGCFDPEPVKQARKKEEVKRERLRCEPKLVSSTGGLKLYRVDDNCVGNSYPVFFSKNGTETTQSWTTRSGKITHTQYRTVQVPNAISQ